MKVLDLECDALHRFEGWFGSLADYASQLERQLIACPMCGSTCVEKRLSAPRLSLGRHAPETEASSALTVAPKPLQPVTDQTAWLAAAAKIVASTDDVGPRFAEEARRIHYGEAQERGIRGVATLAETQSLVEEGIDVMPFAMPQALKNPLH